MGCTEQYRTVHIHSVVQDVEQFTLGAVQCSTGQDVEQYTYTQCSTEQYVGQYIYCTRTGQNRTGQDRTGQDRTG